MDDVTASIIIACQTAGAVNSISKLGFALGMLAKEAWNFGSDSIKVFSDLQEETQKFGIVFAGVNKQANAVVQDLIDNFGQSELSARKMMAQTGDMLTGFGLGSKDVLDLSAAMSKMGADIASFSNYAGGAEGATYALTKAMLGETEQAKMLGVAIKTDTPEFKKLEKQAQSTGIYIKELGRTFTASTAQEGRAIAVAATIYQQKAHVLGDFARNQGSIANQSRTMSNRLEELKATVGGFLDSIVQTGNIKGQFADMFKNITDVIKANSSEWAYHISSFLNIGRGGFELIWTVAKNAFSNIAVVGEYVWDSLVQAWKDAPGFFGAIWEDIKNIADNSWDFMTVSIQGEFQFWGEVLKSFLTNWKSIFNDLWEIAKRSLKSIWTYFAEGIKSIGNLAASLGENFWDLLTGKKKFSEAIGGVVDTYLKGLNDIATGIASEWDGFEFGKGTKQFGKDVADAYLEYQNKRLEAGAKIFGEAFSQTEKYLTRNGIKMGQFTSMTAGLDDVVDAYHRRQREIDANRGKAIEQENGNLHNNNREFSSTSFAASMKRIAEDIFHYRDTTQSAVMANSLEAVRLQSRIMSQNGNNPQVELVEYSRKQYDLLKQIANNTGKNGQTLTVWTP